MSPSVKEGKPGEISGAKAAITILIVVIVIVLIAGYITWWRPTHSTSANTETPVIPRMPYGSMGPHYKPGALNAPGAPGAPTNPPPPPAPTNP